MENLILKTSCGKTITCTIEEAKQMAKATKRTVEFDFNGIRCLVSENTRCENLLRDFENSFIMGWKTIGLECDWQYSPDVEIELYTRKLNLAKQRKKDSLNETL
jgi:BioD-like phosphotransacetylase family protein